MGQIFDLPGPATLNIACQAGFGPGTGTAVFLSNPGTDALQWWLDEGGSNPRVGFTEGSALDAVSTQQTEPDYQVWRGNYEAGSFTAFVFTETADSGMERFCSWSAQLIVDP